MTGISILTMFAAFAVVVSVLLYFVARDQQRQRRRIKETQQYLQALHEQAATISRQLRDR
jgi:preprotein translocase subunit YajC